MHVIGLTGGIASGKSTAAKALRELGAYVIDADAISRRLTAPGGAAEPAILERFGTLDRRALGAIVFADARARRDLNNIVHPMVRRQIEAELAACDAPVAVLDVPLLYEANMTSLVDEVWVVYVPEEEQLRRVMARDGLTALEATARIQSQMSTEEKKRYADVTIDTSGSIADTRMNIEDLWQETLKGLGIEPEHYLIPPAIRRHRNAALRERQRREAEEQGNRKIVHMRPLEPPPDAWEDTSTLMEMTDEQTFFSRQPRWFWVALSVLVVALLIVSATAGVTILRENQAEKAEHRRLQQIADERATYKLVYRDLIETYAAEQSLDPAFVAAVIYNESRFKPNAVSNLGARGLMQIMPDTGEWIASSIGDSAGYSFDNMFDPETNIRYGTWYYGFLARTFDGDIIKMIAGYHAGQNAVLRWLANPEYSSDGQTLDVIPYPDTEQYVQRVVAVYEIYERNYFSPDAEVLPPEYHNLG